MMTENKNYERSTAQYDDRKIRFHELKTSIE